MVEILLLHNVRKKKEKWFWGHWYHEVYQNFIVHQFFKLLMGKLETNVQSWNYLHINLIINKQILIINS